VDELCDVGAAAELLLPAAAVLESPVGLADADVCVEGDVPVLPAVLWLPACGSVDEIATEPAVVALPWLAVDRLLKAREPMTAIPAKPPVVVTRRASERRRWEWRLRWLRKPPAEPSSGTNSDVAAAVVAAAASVADMGSKSSERGAACARALSPARPRSRSNWRPRSRSR
jgi:hypothetical protein